MPTSSSKPLITAPLSLPQTEARQPAALRSLRALLHAGTSMPGFCLTCPHASVGTTPSAVPAPAPAHQPQPHSNLKGHPVNWAPWPRRLLSPGSPWQVCPAAFIRARPPITTPELPGAAAALAHTPARLLRTRLLSRLLPGRLPEHEVMGVDVPTLAGAVQNASVTHHGTPDAGGKPVPGGKQLGALGVVQKAQGGGDGCERGTRCGAMPGAVLDLPGLFLALHLLEA